MRNVGIGMLFWFQISGAWAVGSPLELNTLQCQSTDGDGDYSVVIGKRGTILATSSLDSFRTKAKDYTVSAGARKGEWRIFDNSRSLELSCFYHLNLGMINHKSVDRLHRRISRAFSRARWCSYYGKNFDALEECLLSLPEGTRISFSRGSKSELQSELKDILAVLESERPDILLNEIRHTKQVLKGG